MYDIISFYFLIEFYFLFFILVNPSMNLEASLYFSATKHGFFYTDAKKGIDREKIVRYLIISYIQKKEHSNSLTQSIITILQDIKFVFCDSVIERTTWQLRRNTPMHIELDSLITKENTSQTPCCFIIVQETPLGLSRYYIVGFAWSNDPRILISPRIHRREQSELISIKASTLNLSFSSTFFNIHDPSNVRTIDDLQDFDASEPQDDLSNDVSHDDVKLDQKLILPNFELKPSPISVRASLACVLAHLYFSCISYAFNRSGKKIEDVIGSWINAVSIYPIESDVATRIIAASACANADTMKMYADCAAGIASYCFSSITDTKIRMLAFKTNGIRFNIQDLSVSFYGRIDHYFHQSATSVTYKQICILRNRLYNSQNQKIESDAMPLWLRSVITNFSEAWKRLCSDEKRPIGFENVKLNFFNEKSETVSDNTIE